VKAVRELRVAGAGGGQRGCEHDWHAFDFADQKRPESFCGRAKERYGRRRPANFFPGSIGDVRLYDRAWSGSRFTAINNAAQSGLP